MKEQLINRIHKEHKEWLAKLKQKSVDEIIRSAYEICYREEFINVLEYMDYDDEQIEKLLQVQNIIDFLYDEWLRTDASVCQMLEDVIDDILWEEN